MSRFRSIFSQFLQLFPSREQKYKRRYIKMSRMFRWSLVLVFALGSANLAFGQTQQPGKQVQVKIAGHMPIGHYLTTACERFIKEAEQRSKGTLKFTYYPAGQLAMDVKALQMCQQGGVEMAQFFLNRATGVVPEATLPQSPYFEDIDTWSRRMYDVAGGAGIYEKLLRQKLAPHNLYVLPGFLYDPVHTTVTVGKSLSKMEDYKGLKFRVSGRELGAALESWGAKAVVMSSADVYMSLQRGTIDGANSGPSSIRSRKWFEMCKQMQILGETIGTLDMIVNLAWWKGLSAEQRTVIEEAMRVSTIWSWEVAWAEFDKDLEDLKSKGVKIFDFRTAAAGELEKMKSAAIPEMEKLIKPTMDNASWEMHISTMKASKTGKLRWKELLPTMKW